MPLKNKISSKLKLNLLIQGKKKNLLDIVSSEDF